MRRRFFRVASGLSLILCVLSVVLWVRSYQYFESLYWTPTPTPTERRVFELALQPGSIVLDCEAVTRAQPEPDWDESGSREIWYQRGFEWKNTRVRAPKPNAARFRWEWTVSVVQTVRAKVLIAELPIWAVSLCLFVLTLLLAWRGRPWRRKLNACAECGYNLTGNTSGVCPECGTRVPQGPGDKVAAIRTTRGSCAARTPRHLRN